MDPLYVIQNQHKLFLDKHGEWVDGSDSQTLYRTAHKDEAINVKVEHAVRSPELRLTLVPVTTNERGRIQITVEAASETASEAVSGAGSEAVSEAASPQASVDSIASQSFPEDAASEEEPSPATEPSGDNLCASSSSEPRS